MNSKDTDTNSDLTGINNEGTFTSEFVGKSEEINETHENEHDQTIHNRPNDVPSEGQKDNILDTEESVCSSNTTTGQSERMSEIDDTVASGNNTTDKIDFYLHKTSREENIESDKALSDREDAEPTEKCGISEKLEEFADLPDNENQSESDMLISAEENGNRGKTETIEPKTNAQETTNKTEVNVEHDCKLANGHEKVAGASVQKEEKAQAVKRELPEWFKVMIGLTHGIHDGKEIEHWEDIRESIDIHGSTQASTVRTNARLIQLVMKKINRIARRDRRSCSCLPNFEALKNTFHSKSKMDLNSLVQSLLEPIADIDDVNISCEGVKAPCHKGGSTLLHIRCTSCQSLYRVVAILNSPLFKDGIVRIKECLEEEMKDKLDIDANITSESIHDVKNHLREQGILKASESFVSCGSHPGKLTEVYCFEHDDICCMNCVKSQHSSCHEVTQVTKDESERKTRQNTKRKVKEYYVRVHSENGDEGNCDIIACCMLTHGEILLADMNNKRLKRLNKKLKVIDVCDLPDCPRDVCYLGNNRVAVILFDHSIQFVDISGSPKLKEKVDLDHDCFGVAYCGDTLYVTDPMSVYTYSLEGKEKGRLYRQLAGHHRFCKIVISKDKKKLYIAAKEGGLVTIDLEGNQLSSLRGRELGIVTDVCVADDSTLLVCNSRMQTVSRVDTEGKSVLEKVAGRSEDMYMPQSLCYDSHGSRLIVGHLHDDYISILNIY